MIKSQSRLQLAESALLSVTIEPDYAQILDVIDRRTPSSASRYNECHAAAKKLRKSSDLDEEGEEDSAGPQLEARVNAKKCDAPLLFFWCSFAFSSRFFA
jgi:hypothetical protein